MYRFPKKFSAQINFHWQFPSNTFIELKKVHRTFLSHAWQRKKTLNHPIFIGNSRFFVDLHDNNTVQILMRTVRLCVHLSCNFCCKVLILFLKTFTSLETNESLKLYRCSNFFGYHLKILSNCLFVLSFYILLL